LAALIDALLRAPLRNSDAVKLIKGALSSGDFIVTPDVSRSPSHLRYVYDPPKSLHVVDVNLITLDYGTLASTDIHWRLVPNGQLIGQQFLFDDPIDPEGSKIGRSPFPFYEPASRSKTLPRKGAS
jgi:hypothetical protein